MKTKTVNALKNLYIANGGSISDVITINNIPDMIEAIAGSDSLNVQVLAEDGESELFDVKVKTYQSACIPLKENILGYWIEVEGGLTPTGTLSGTGYFVALKFVNTCNADKIEVGVEPSETNMGLVELDEDMNAVFKISNFNTQKIVVKVTKGETSKITKYTLNVMRM